MTISALADVKITDFSWIVAGPSTTELLAQFGATVIRVESKERPDTLRTNLPYKDNKPGIDRSGYFAFFNANKYSIALNLNHPKAREIARKLIIWSGIVVDNFRPGIMEKWELGYKELAQERPDLIMLSVSSQGQKGPFARHFSFGAQLAGLCGFTEMTGWPDREPSQPYGTYTDVIAPYFGAAVLLACLDYRRRTGKGQYIDLSQVEASEQFIAPMLLDYFVNGRINSRKGNKHNSAAPHGVYQCQGDDKWCAITVMNDAQWQAFRQVVPTHGATWATEKRFSTLLDRKQHEAELDDLIEQWTKEHTAEEIASWLRDAGVPASVAQTPEDLLNDRQLKERNYFWALAHPVLGTFHHIGPASQLSKTPAKPRMPAPCLGEHTEYVCHEILGISDEEFVALLAEGIFE